MQLSPILPISDYTSPKVSQIKESQEMALEPEID